MKRAEMSLKENEDTLNMLTGVVVFVDLNENDIYKSLAKLHYLL